MILHLVNPKRLDLYLVVFFFCIYLTLNNFALLILVKGCEDHWCLLYYIVVHFHTQTIESNSLLCLKTLMVAPERRNPRMSEAWFFSSEMTTHPGDIMQGRLSELVAKPMPKTMASSTPRNLAVSCSSSSWSWTGPRSLLGLQDATPYFFIDSIASSAHFPDDSANPR